MMDLRPHFPERTEVRVPLPSMGSGAGRRHRRVRLTMFAFAITTLCGACGPAASSAARTGPSTTFVVSSTPARLAQCPAPRPLSDLRVIARPRVAPDDLTVDRVGNIWVSATAAGVIFELSASGATLRTYSDAHLPEGLAVTAGRVLVAEQGVGANRIRVLDPATGAFTPLAAVPSALPYGGVDGIALDGAGPRLLVPDSGAGTLLSVGLHRGDERVLATGLGRPVSAARGAGRLYVAAESEPGLVMVAANGTVHRLGTLSNLDEVVWQGGLLYVTDLTFETVDAVDPTSGAARVLVTGVAQPQGLASDGKGGLLVTDSGSGVVAHMTAC